MRGREGLNRGRCVDGPFDLLQFAEEGHLRGANGGLISGRSREALGAAATLRLEVGRKGWACAGGECSAGARSLGARQCRLGSLHECTLPRRGGWVASPSASRCGMGDGRWAMVRGALD